MKTWTQMEYDAAARTSHGVILGTGDFRGIDFRGRHALIIGPKSIIGPDAQLGEGCEIGERSDIGNGLRLGAFGQIGQNCRIGRDAQLGEGCIIGRGTSLATGCAIGPGAEIGDGVQLPGKCRYLLDYRAENADGRTLIKCVPVYGQTVQAFIAEKDGRRTVCIAVRGNLMTLEEFEEWAADAACCTGMTGTREAILNGRRMLATAKYIRALYSAAGMCEGRRGA